MKKMPTLFERVFENHRIVRILPNVSPDLAWVMSGEGVATIKWDGTCCAVINGVFYKRYDAKHGKPIPSNAIKCQENADPVTGHLPCWVPCDRTATGDKWFWDAYDRMGIVPDGTYEAIGPHFRANPYNLDADVLKPHGKDIVELDRRHPHLSGNPCDRRDRLLERWTPSVQDQTQGFRVPVGKMIA